MYTILMNKDKSLVTTEIATLYQNENLVDKIQFLFPKMYEDLNLSECTIILKCVLPGNVAYEEELKTDEELYKGKVRCMLPVDSNLSSFAGDIGLRVYFVRTEINENKRNLYTGETQINILPITQYNHIPIIGNTADKIPIEVIDEALGVTHDE